GVEALAGHEVGRRRALVVAELRRGADEAAVRVGVLPRLVVAERVAKALLGGGDGRGLARLRGQRRGEEQGEEQEERLHREGRLGGGDAKIADGAPHCSVRSPAALTPTRSSRAASRRRRRRRG